jgi:outer membrane protein assembly factor BamB
MNEKVLNLSLILGTIVIGCGLLFWWILYNPVSDLVEFIPGLDNRPATSGIIESTVSIGSFFESYQGTAGEMPGSWPRFRGAEYDNISKDNSKLANGWGEGGPTLLWSVDLGEGHAGPVISDGRVYLLDYDEINRREILRCFSFDDGRELWRRGYDIFIKRNHGMSRTVPAVSDHYVVTIGPKCHVMCVDADSGTFKWGIDLVKEYGTEVPLWYTGQCPLIDDSLAIIAVGGSSLIIAVHCETGEVAWEIPNPGNWKMSHSSIMPMVIFGKKFYIYCSLNGMIGISAEKASRGQILFQSTEWRQSVIAPSPVYCGNGRIFVTAGYGAGSQLFQVAQENGLYALNVIQKLKPDQGLASEQQTPIFYQGYLFAILPKDAGALRNQFVCCHPEDCSKIIWSSGKTKRFGLGPYLVADGKFYILSDEGVLTVIKAEAKEYIELAEVKILDGHDAWGPMAIANGRLIARDSRRMICINLKGVIS